MTTTYLGKQKGKQVTNNKYGRQHANTDARQII